MKKLIIVFVTILICLTGTLKAQICILPNQPATISITGGSAKVCPGDVRIYTTALVSGVTYFWTVPSGAQINSGQGTRSINVTYTNGFTANDSINVIAVNGCGNSIPRVLKVLRNTPSTPGTITGITTALCGKSGVTYTIINVAGTLYNWMVPSGVTLVSGQQTNSISVNYPTAPFSGNVAVTASNACGTSAARTKAVKGTPPTPAATFGPTCVVPNSIGNAFYIAPVASAVSYTWEGPVGSHITASGVTSVSNLLTTPDTAVTVSFGNLTVTSALNVRANTPCANGTPKKLILTICLPNRLNAETIIMGTTLFPNPTNGILKLRFNSAGNNFFNCFITDLTGREIINQNIEASVGWNETIFNLSALDNGIYLVQLKSSDCNSTMRISKQ